MANTLIWCGGGMASTAPRPTQAAFNERTFVSAFWQTRASCSSDDTEVLQGLLGRTDRVPRVHLGIAEPGCTHATGNSVRRHRMAELCWLSPMAACLHKGVSPGSGGMGSRRVRFLVGRSCLLARRDSVVAYDARSSSMTERRRWRQNARAR